MLRTLRNCGIYTLDGLPLVVLKRSDLLYFLFTQKNWNLHGPVEYRVSHGQIYHHGILTSWTDADLVDTGISANSVFSLALRRIFR